MTIETDMRTPSAEDARRRAEQQVDAAEKGGELPPVAADTHTPADPAVETPIEGRQGFKGTPVLAVLIGGLVLAMVAWIVVEMVAY
jgi:hypothetical protein